MVQITKTLSIAELKMLQRSDPTTVTNALLLAKILEDCTDLTAEQLFALTEPEILAIFGQLFDKSLATISVSVPLVAKPVADEKMCKNKMNGITGAKKPNFCNNGFSMAPSQNQEGVCQE
jgi:hypothetical protein